MFFGLFITVAVQYSARCSTGINLMHRNRLKANPSSFCHLEAHMRLCFSVKFLEIGPCCVLRMPVVSAVLFIWNESWFLCFSNYALYTDPCHDASYFRITEYLRAARKWISLIKLLPTRRSELTLIKNSIVSGTNGRCMDTSYELISGDVRKAPRFILSRHPQKFPSFHSRQRHVV